MAAKEENMPKDNIERAIKKGIGGGEGASNYEEFTYEGYGPGGAAVIVEIMTDNKNRTVAEIRHIFLKTWRQSWRKRMCGLDLCQKRKHYH